MITRWAEKEDLDSVYVMYLSALRETKEPHDEKDALEFMLLCWAKAPCILLISGDSIVGFAGLNTYSPAINRKQVYLRDYMFYVSKPHRCLKAWRMLSKATQEVADKFKLTFVGEHRLQGTIKHHERLIRMAGAKPFAILSEYEGK